MDISISILKFKTLYLSALEFYLFIYLFFQKTLPVLSAGAVEYTNCTSAEE